MMNAKKKITPKQKELVVEFLLRSGISTNVFEWDERVGIPSRTVKALVKDGQFEVKVTRYKIRLTTKGVSVLSSLLNEEGKKRLALMKRWSLLKGIK